MAEAGEDSANFYCSILNDVLDKLMEKVSGSNKHEKTGKVSNALRYISKMYTGKISTTPGQPGSICPQWNLPEHCCAYIFLYLMQHCHLVSYSLQNYDISSSWGGKGNLKVCSVGGGPGSDLIGLTTILQKKNIFPDSLECLVLDLFLEWKETWDTIYNSSTGLPEELQKYKKIQKMKYKKCDIVNDTSLATSSDRFIRKADILTLVKFFSVVADAFRASPEKGDLLKSILGRLKPGCFVLYIDSVHFSNSHFEQEFASPLGLERVDTCTYEGEVVFPVQYLDWPTVRQYRQDLDYNPLSRCNVLIQLYKKPEVQLASQPGPAASSE